MMASNLVNRMLMPETSRHEQNTHRIDRKTVRRTHQSLSEPGQTGLCVSNSTLQSVQLYPLLAPYRLSMGTTAGGHKSGFRKKEISYSAVYHHFSKWSHDPSLKTVWKQSILTIQDDLNLSELNLDGSHTLAKKGGQSVAYQRRKKGKTSNILPITDSNGYIIASMGIIAGNHIDAYQLKPHLQTAFKEMKKLGLPILGPISMLIKPLIPKMPGKLALITDLFPIYRKTSAIENGPNEDANGYSMKKSITGVFVPSVPLPGSTNSNGYSSVLNVMIPVSLVHIASHLL
jgi:hypothetical protein